MIGKLTQLTKSVAGFRNASNSQQQSEFEQRLLTEAVRLHEDAQGFAIEDPQADANAREVDGDLEHRLIARAHSLAIAPVLRTALHQLYTTFAVSVGIGAFVALLAGASAARVALNSQPEGPVINFFWVLGSVLGVPTLALLLWLGFLFLKPGAVASHSLGGSVAFLIGQRLNHWLHKGPLHVAAAQALGLVYARTMIGRWTFSAVSHGLWLAFLLGCLISLLLILSTKQYTFAWETTILSDRSYIFLTRTLASVPEAVGFSAPTAEQIAASHWRGQGDPPGAAREAWAGLLVGSLMVYGILPRVLLLILCLWMQRCATARFRLDVTLPGYGRLQTRVVPTSRDIGVVDPDDNHQVREAPAKTAPVHPPPPVAATGPPAILGFEIDHPASQWPPFIKGVTWLDLGFIDSRKDRQSVLEHMQDVPNPPRLVAIVCSVAMTPDRGTRGFIGEVQEATQVPVVIILTDGQRLRERSSADEAQQRFHDWRELAMDAQVAEEHIIDVDLNHLTEKSRAKLAAALGSLVKATASAPHLEQAFDLIIDHVKRWSTTPDAAAQAELHRAIATLYRNERNTWQALLRTKVPVDGDVVGQLRSSADHMLDLLPPRLRMNPRWYAAGALAGALGCVTAATLVAPVAIGSLPLWAGLGAALPLVVKSGGKKQPAEEKVEIDFTEAVNGAALFAMLLELQGYDEIQITRILDRVVADTEPPRIESVDMARQWLDNLRQRMGRVRAAETTL